MPSRAMLGRHVRVTDQRTGRSVVVLVNDVGPSARLHRVIDLSRGAEEAGLHPPGNGEGMHNLVWFR